VKMLSQNFHIGSHGLTHSNLTTLKNENLKMEFINSKHLLEEIIGKSVDVISAPGGYMNYATKNIGLLNGYNFVATSIEWPVTKRFMTQRKTINRTCIRNTFSESTYKKILSNDLSFFMMRRLRAGIYYFPKKLIDKKLV